MRQKDDPWHPIKDPVDLKTLGKLGEELNECGSAVSRCIIQGMDGTEPDTGKPNREWLENEIADVYAGLLLAINRFELDALRIQNRMLMKIERLKVWHEQA